MLGNMSGNMSSGSQRSNINSKRTGGSIDNKESIHAKRTSGSIDKDSKGLNI
jgi:hypothetical protein